MTTLGDLLRATEDHAFVGRDAQLDVFASWLDARGTLPGVLEVVGRGGIGKSTLLRRMAAIADARGARLVRVDGGVVRPDPDALAAALGAPTLEQAAATTGPTAVVLVDAAEHLLPVRRALLERYLARLDADVRVVLAGRTSLLPPGDTGRRWAALARRVELDAFDDATALAYLERRGMTDRALAADVRAVTRGHPLALAMAADIAALGGTAVDGSDDWASTTRALARQLVRDVAGPELRAALQAAALVRRLDADLLAAMVDDPKPTDRVDDLARLSLVRRDGSHVQVHDDVRQILAGDLRLDDPVLLADRKARALAHYQARARRRPDGPADALVDAFFLAEDAVVQSMVFGDGTAPGDVAVEPATTSAHHDEAMRLEETWHHHVMPAMGIVPGGELYEQHDHFEDYAPILRHPHARLVLARDAAGAAVGYSLVVPVTRSSVEVLVPNPVLGPTVRAAVELGGGRGALPEDPCDARLHHLTQMAIVTEDVTPVQAALWRDLLPVLGRGGLFSVTLGLEEHARLMASLGFEELDGTRVAGWCNVEHLGMLLDLRDGGVEAWVADRVIPSLATPTGATDCRPATTIRVIGDFRVQGPGDVEAPAGIPGRVVGLLAVRAEPVHVEELVDELWPDAAPDQGRTRLRNVLARVREACGPVVAREGDVLRLAPDVAVDLHRFLAEADVALAGLRDGRPGAISAGRRALAAGRGQVLPGEPYAGWAVMAREQHRRRLLALLDGLAAATADAGDLEAAAELAREAIALEPFDDVRYARAAGWLAAAGRQGAATEVVDGAVRALDELGVPPSRALRELLDAPWHAGGAPRRETTER